MNIEQQQRLYDAVKQISRYQDPGKLKKNSLKTLGLEGEEAVEMAYENVLSEARAAIKGVRRPKAGKEVK